MTQLTSPMERRRSARALAGVVAAWAAGVSLLGATGVFSAIPLPLIAALVAVGIVTPIVAYNRDPKLRAAIEQLGLRRLTALHAWRVPAALAFFWYGSQDQLPELFVTFAAWGDLAAGLAAVFVSLRPVSARVYAAFHAFGFFDFVLAVGTGLTFSLIEHPAMHTIATFPLVLIPLFGVGLSGATHVMAFDLLKRGRGR